MLTQYTDGLAKSVGLFTEHTTEHENYACLKCSQAKISNVEKIGIDIDGLKINFYFMLVL